MIGSWARPLEPGKMSSASTLNSNKVEARKPLEYSKEDIQHIEKWSKQRRNLTQRSIS